MITWIKRLALVVFLLLQASCSEWQPNTFTLVGELPPGFSYWAGVYYVPEPGTDCNIKDWRRTMPEHNRPWLGEYRSEIKINIKTIIKGCRMVVDDIDIKIFARWTDVGMGQTYDRAGLMFRTELEDKHKRIFNSKDESEFYGECYWVFKTSGKYRSLTKYIECRKDLERGERGKGKPSAIYARDQLPGKTIKMSIRLLDKEKPGVKDTWIEFPNGWKRCLGDGFEDPYGFCRGNTSDFSYYTGPYGEICTIYPGCEE
ncbi:hypothetical protein [Pseudomonas sp. NPDC089401]|uniref:hypothetical protein n=1 Tax=Pseudomonas sp. NPDC089401 TaxID=3364462 RepID=UPI0037F202E1